MNKDAETIRILVVDDERDIREGSERILSRMGYQLQTAARGDEALEIFAKVRPAIVLLDLKMPGMDGMEVLQRLRVLDPSLLVIVITGYATVETAIEAMKQGAYDFIPKPFEPDQLRIVVNRAAEKIRLTRETQKLELEKTRTLADLDTEKSRLRTIIESLPDGVLVTNTTGQVVLLNPAGRKVLKLGSETAPGRSLEDYLPDEDLRRLVLEISKGKHVDFEDIPEKEFTLADGTTLRALAQPVLGDRRECLGAIVTFLDITSLKELDRLKSEFVAKVSHELRSPLSTIHEQLATVISDLVGTEPQQHMLTRAKEKTQTLISFIGDMLDLSRIEEGLICREPRPVHLEELLQSIVEFLSVRAKAKNQSLTIEVAGRDLPEIEADPVALESIFGNLISNALTYTPEGGRIRVELDRTGINLRVKVIDNGFGIAEKHLGKIFDRFYRVKDEKTRYITGTGLGLPIVKGLVEKLSGIIEVASTPGEGSTFTVLLPVKS
ncbi:MAG: response regulator [Desulfobacterota bacterium]|nr:response regulator [Thermodesulfobacteriota bacterium]